MSFPRYPKYKASGVEWLGEVPEGWEVTRVGFLCCKIGSGKTPTGGGDAYINEGIIFIRSQNVYDDGLRLDDVVFVSEQIDAEQSWSRVLSGDILLNITGASLGRTCLVPSGFGRANVNQHVCILRLKSAGSRNFVSMVLKSSGMKSQFDATQNGAAREGLNFAQISKLSFALPPLAEQTAIAAFLDRETAKIDELVAEQRRLMELLKEKRQAVISHAVTKGLNPHAKMKPSGVEWLGEVPEGWVTCALKRLVRMQSGESITGESIAETGAYPVYGGNGLRGFTSEFTHDGTYVLIGRQGALCGNINYAHEKFWASEHAVVATPTKPVDTFWLGEMLRTMNLNQYSIAAAQPGLSVEVVGRLGIPVPPLTEQKAIAAYLTAELAKFDTLTAEAQHAIDLLQERRTALISAAVTGQIDVRQPAWN